MNTSTKKIEAMYVRVHIRAWKGRRQHKAAGRDVCAQYSAADRSAQVQVQLTDSPALLELHKLHAKARITDHYRLTLSGCGENMRLLPAGREFEHAETMQRNKVEHDRLVAAFLADYDELHRLGIARLGRLYDPEHWPEAHTMPGRFEFSCQYLPAPIEGPWGDFLAESVEAATRDLRQRVTDCLAHAVEAFSSKAPKFRDTLTANMADLGALLPDLNLAGDQALERAGEALREIGNMQAETLRTDEGARTKAAGRINDILGSFR